MKTWISTALVAAIAVTLGSFGAAFGASPSTSPGGSRASCLDWVSRSPAASTTSTAWHTVPGMTLSELNALNYAVQFSGSFSGAPVRVRMRDASVGGTFTMAPGGTRVPGSVVRSAFSFTWVGSSPAEHQHTFRLQWRLVSPGGTSTLRSGAMTATYLGAPTATTCREQT
ncbi:MAG TPA: hypothetical protein VLX89_03195 [Actinomycetota bacterium]|nr:hypothetical protein [Actinomycetota bacterium]